MNNFLKTFLYPPIWLIKKIFAIIFWLIKFPFRLIGDVFSFKKAKVSSAVFLIIILALFAGFLDYPKYWNQGADYINQNSKFQFVNSKFQIPHFWDISFKLGLDLQGGTHLVYDADLSGVEDGNKAEAMNGLRDVIERRVNLYGIGEPVVQVNKTANGQYRLIVELAGIKNVSDAIKMIGETPYLEFRTMRSQEETAAILEKQKSGDFASLMEDPYTLPSQLTGKYLKKSTLAFDPNSRKPIVELEFNDEGAKLFEQLTEQNIGNQIAIYLDRSPISAPRVNEKITGGKAVISGQFTIDEAKQMVQRLNSGALPVPIQLVSQQSVEASLGQVTLDKSLKAGLYAFLAVAIFMVLWYRIPGLLAVLALGIYTALVLAVFKIFGATLTLAGIAGFILSIGMAVDANILIFARMREEFRNGKTFAQSVEEGFRRAWPSIRDSNSTTLLTCLVLYFFTTSVVRGFALTLAIGVIVSMFSAIFITRIFLKGFIGTWAEKFNWIWYK